MAVLNKFLMLALSQVIILLIGCLLKKVNKPARNRLQIHSKSERSNEAPGRNGDCRELGGAQT